MALSPWHVVSRLSCEEAAGLLGGYDITAAKAGDIRGHQLYELNEWRRVIVEAAQRGELKPVVVEELIIEGEPDPVERAYTETNRYWSRCGSDNLSWTLRSDINFLRLTLERQEVYRWLRSSGVADHDIPEALRVMPKSQASVSQQDKPIHHHRRKTYLKLIEGLTLDALGGEIPDEPYAAAVALQAVLDRHALKLDDEPIAKTVKEIQAIREERESDPFNSM